MSLTTLQTVLYSRAALGAIMKTFSMTHLFFDFAEPEVFTEDKAPEWLTKGDYLHFWNNCVLKLEVSGFVDTDFRRITRIK